MSKFFIKVVPDRFGIEGVMNYEVRLIKVIGFTDCFSNCIARVKKLLLETDCICLAVVVTLVACCCRLNHQH